MWVNPIHGGLLEYFHLMRGAIPNDPITRYQDPQTFVPCDWDEIERPEMFLKWSELKGGYIIR